MLKELMAYGSMSTKIRAMKSRLITAEGYYYIASMQSVAELAAYLKTIPSYAKALGNVNKANIHRGDIEKLLQLSLYDDYAKIVVFANPKQRSFLKIYFLRYEIQIIKVFLRLIFDHRDISFDTSLIPEQFKHQTNVNLTALAACKTLDEFFETIRGSDFYKLLNPLRDLPSIGPFDYELALDIYYYKCLWRLKNKILKKDEWKQITRIYGTEMDMLNIIFIYRSKKFYQVEPSLIYSNLIPIHYKLSVPLLRRLVDSETLDEFRALMGNSNYGKILQRITTETDNPEVLYRQVMMKLQKDAAARFPYSLAIVNYYLYLKEEEINKLTTALECIRYGLDSSQIVNYIL